MILFLGCFKMEKGFIINPQKIANKLIKQLNKNKKLNIVQKTLLEQIILQNPFFINEYNITNIIIIDKYTLRFHSRLNNKITNIDIKYNPVPDLYEIKAYRIKNYGLDEEEIYKNEYVFFTELEPIIREIVFNR
jgi:hypothetical protein